MYQNELFLHLRVLLDQFWGGKADSEVKNSLEPTFGTPTGP